jgi:ethanolamine utilization protein EutA (predicted chaperonin)
VFYSPARKRGFQPSALNFIVKDFAIACSQVPNWNRSRQRISLAAKIYFSPVFQSTYTQFADDEAQFRAYIDATFSQD